MSYDVAVAGSGEAHNYTYNAYEMLRIIGLRVPTWNGKPAWLVAGRLREALELAKLPHVAEELRAAEPDNGWGDRDGMLRWLNAILSDLDDAPSALVEVY